MKHFAAYLLCVLGGNATPSVDDITKVIVAGGGSADEDSLNKLIEELAGKEVSEILAAGYTKVSDASKCGGGGAAPAAAAGGAAAPAAAAAAPKEEEVDALEGGMDMFGGGGGGDY